MEKPTIFFSHSSKDKNYIQELKRLINKQTSNTIEIFQSSDGESIPFGSNWVYKIEEKLTNSKIMFVFVSPNSIKSEWIYFESGFSYSKGIRVIPIGILGIDIGNMQAPMSLLQGFNIRNKEGLNNIIAILNNEFDCKFETDFTDLEFEILQDKTDISNTIKNDVFRYIDYFETEFSSKLQDKTFIANTLETFKQYFKENKIQNSPTKENLLYLYGMEIAYISSKDNKRFKFKIDLLRLSENLQIISKILPLIYKEKIDKYFILVYFNNDIDLITTNYKLSARLCEFEIHMSEINGNLYVYKNLLFALDDVDRASMYRKNTKEQKALRIIYNPMNPNVNEILELIDFLFSINVIYSKI